MSASRRLPTLLPDVFLQVPVAADSEAITAWCQDPEIQEWTTIPVPYRPVDADDFLAHVERAWVSGTEWTWAIRRGAPLVGMIGLSAQPLGSAEVGYWLARPARGQGVMSAALAAVVAHAFDPMGLDLHRLEWHAFVGNEPSRKVAERNGFVVEGTVRGLGIQRGARRDSWIGTLLRPEAFPAFHA